MDGRPERNPVGQSPKKDTHNMMRSKNSARRLYTRAGRPLVCISGAYFGPKSDEPTFVDASKEITHETLEPVEGVRCIRIEQIAAGGASIVEVWYETQPKFTHRSPKDDAIGSQLPSAPSA